MLPAELYIADTILPDVHHFAGNNVSHTSLYPISPRPTVQRRDVFCLQDLPNEEVLTQDFGGYINVLTSCSQIELGTACGKLYRCSTMAVLDAGDSDILTGATA